MIASAVAVSMGLALSGAQAQTPPLDPAKLWNTAKAKLLRGEKIVGGTVRAGDAETYCAMAAAGYDFIWIEMQHEKTSWETASRMVRTCPGPAVPGVRVADASERELQHATDMGAMVIMVPTIDSVEEAKQAVMWTKYPPFGRRSAGGGQGPSNIWNRVPGGYRETFNDNVLLILMIETLEGVAVVDQIAAVPGVDAVFAASGDLANFSGSQEGQPLYEGLVTKIHDAAMKAGVKLCGPLRWATRPNYTCFQGGNEAGLIRTGAQEELKIVRPPQPNR
jgi:2-keto-3-deoxy-L-rhamnonate aldolase RhmA